MQTQVALHKLGSNASRPLSHWKTAILAFASEVNLHSSMTDRKPHAVFPLPDMQVHIKYVPHVDTRNMVSPKTCPCYPIQGHGPTETTMLLLQMPSWERRMRMQICTVPAGSSHGFPQFCPPSASPTSRTQYQWVIPLLQLFCRAYGFC